LMNPKEVSVSPPATAAVTVQQSLVRVRGDQKAKRAALRALLRSDEVASALIFCNRKRDVDILFKSLKRHDFSVAALHGDMAQPVRMETLARFKNGEVRLLVCSDVAARGLDIPKVSHVFNFDVPVNAEDYVHRIGRTGRAGRSGIAISLALPEEMKALKAVTEMLGRDIPEIALEGIEAWDTADAEASAGGRRRGGRRRDGSDRGRGRGRSRGERKERLSDAAVGERRKPQPDLTEDRAIEASAETTPKEPVEPVKGRTKGASEPRKPRSQPASSQDHPFGEHAPAFLFKSVRVA